jgi:hypothetical protein
MRDVINLLVTFSLKQRPRLSGFLGITLPQRHMGLKSASCEFNAGQPSLYTCDRIDLSATDVRGTYFGEENKRILKIFITIIGILRLVPCHGFRLSFHQAWKFDDRLVHN